jgi:hypothetical protein
MTTLSPSLGVEEPHVRSVLQRVADALGWTAGQVWTMVVGLAVAVPAAVFGLGPTLADVDDAAPFAAAPPAAQTSAPSPPAAAAPPAILATTGTGGSTAPTGGGSTSPATGSDTAAPPVVAVPSPTADGPFATIPGPGAVQAVAMAADAVVLSVDPGGSFPGHVIVLGGDGVTVLDRELEIDGAGYANPRGVAVTDGGVFVATSLPPAILRVTVADGTVTKVADLPDVPLCLPLAPASDCQVAVPDQPSKPAHIAVADDGTIYVADRGQACVLRIAAGADRATAWLCDLEYVGFPATPDAGLTGIDVDGTRLVLSVGSAVDQTDRVEEVAIDGESPGARRQLAAPASGSRAGGLVTLPDGGVAVTLTGTSSLLLIAADGSSREVPLDGVSGPIDVDVVADTMVVAYWEPGAFLSGAQPRGQAMALVSRYCSKPAVPFWRPMPLIL